ncbi:MAG TPA: DAK2 domain-containing protein, partial [Actinomycetes bacterium]
MSIAAASAPSTPLQVLDADAVLRWATVGRDALAAAREEIDELNVYPVPDGDTGTNLHLTVSAAVDEIATSGGEAPASPGGVLATLAHGALLGARGNSGVILSQLLRGIADAVGLTDGPVDAGTVSRALASGAQAAYAAVAQPVEGTMLTVAREAAEAAEAAGGLAEIVQRAAAGARVALARTPDQLEVLRRAGVVDAGGRGVCVLLDALASVVTGAEPEPTAVRVEAHARARAEGQSEYAGGAAPSSSDAGEAPESGPAFEVMFLLEATADAVRAMRDRL